MKKTHEIITTVLFTGLIAVFGILHVVLPDGTLSHSERRTLSPFPTVTTTTVFDGTFMQNLEKYLPDQFPFREAFRSVKAVFEKASGRLDASDIYTVDGHLAKLDYTLNESSTVKAGAKLEKIRELFGADRSVLAVIPQKTYYMADGVHPQLDHDKMVSLLYENAPGYETVDITGTLTLDSYYKTDSHWRQEMLGDTVATLLTALGQDATAPSYESNEITDFRGVYVGQSALPVEPESMFYLTNDILANATVTTVGAEVSEIYTLGKLDDPKSVDKYDIYLGGAVPLITIDNPAAKSDRTLVLVRDSFGSSIAPLFVDAYKTIHVVDLRYIASQVLPQFIETTENTDLLVLLSTGIINSSELLRVQ